MVSPISGVGENEVFIGDTYFPTKGPVRLTNISVVPNPVIFGDTNRAGDTQIMSQQVQTSAAGGSGVWRANSRTDIDRHWKSRVETAFRDQLTLPPLVYDMGKPAGLTTHDPLVSEEYQNAQYFGWSGAGLYRWNDAAATFGDGTATGGWSSLLATLPANPTDMRVWKDVLWIACDTALAYWELPAATLTTVTSTPAKYLEVWDERLYRLAQVSGVWTLYHTTSNPSAGSMSWTTGGVFPSDVLPTQLLTFRNVTGDVVLAAVTNVGLWLYDATNAKWKHTEIRIPRLAFGQESKACLFRDGKLYFTSGNLGLVSVQPGNPFVATPVGLDTEDGVPSEDSGRISRVTADFNFVLALVDSTTVVSEDEYLSGVHNPIDGWDWQVVTGYSTLRKWNGGWHVLWESGESAGAGYFLVTSGAYDKRRAYWGNGGRVFCTDLYSGVHNPRRNPAAKFAAGPKSHITPWFDYGSDVQSKIQGHVYLRTAGCSATEKVTVYYARDMDDVNWTLLGEITTDGVHTFKPGAAPGQGVPGKTFRFRFDLQRGSDQTKTPVIEFWTAEFLRLLPAQYGYAVEIDLTRPHRGNTPAQMVAAIQRLADPAQTQTLILFAYKDTHDAEPQTHWARISKLDGIEYSGQELRGQSSYRVSLMVPYKEDSA